ncbi:hypothetical protein K402DRAFT_406202 [Aulographum hederae CBS 113979]|uniref:MARVEL domain-containing protein n=1 Tax=Aulographum hederae CBS 113979 TaxID=1176131 RepID=A0A6G1GTV0_9PEZI|nr:hypothetical protein K402DRAFT_406202 [Aulographum hederae CBS 113979]
MIIPIILRSVQIIFAAVSLGLAVGVLTSINDFSNWDSVYKPTQLTYAAFCGGFGIFAGLVGFVAIFFDKLDGIVTWVIDGLAALFFLAGGIAVAVAMKGVTCTDYTKEYCYTDDNDRPECQKLPYGDKLQGWCQMIEADAAFLFLAFIVCVGVFGLSFAMHRKGRSSKLGV